MQVVRFSELSYYEIFNKKDYIKELADLYGSHIRHYAEQIGYEFARKMLKDLIKTHFKQEENVNIDYRVNACIKFTEELFNKMMRG